MPMMKKPRSDGHLMDGFHRSPQAKAYMILNIINCIKNHVGPQLYVPEGKSNLFGKKSDRKPARRVTRLVRLVGFGISLQIISTLPYSTNVPRKKEYTTKGMSRRFALSNKNSCTPFLSKLFGTKYPETLVSIRLIVESKD